MAKVHGAGTIDKRQDRQGKTYYRIRHSLGYDEVAQKYVYSKWRGHYSTKAEAREALVEYRKELEGGLKLDADNLTFGELADQFHEIRIGKGIVGDETIKKDKYLIKRLKKYLGDVAVTDIDAPLLDAIYIRIRKEEDVSDNTLYMTHVKLKQIIKFAVRRKYIVRNPYDDFDSSDSPKQPMLSSRNSLTQEEFTRFIETLSERDHSSHRMVVWIAMATGMRRSEILGLQWRWVNLEEAYIDVRQTLTKKMTIRDKAKTDTSIRRIPIDQNTIRRLKDWKIQQAEYFLSLGNAHNEKSPVISSEVCGFLDPDNFQRWWWDFSVAVGFGHYTDDEGNEIPVQRYNEKGHPVDENGCPYSRVNKKPKIRKHYEGLHLHELRHTYATRLINSGVNYKTVQVLLGHADPATTLRMYAHAEEGEKRLASDLIGELMKVPKKTDKIVSL